MNETYSLYMQLRYYQLRMMEEKVGTIEHEIYKQKTRHLTEEIRQKEMAVCSQQTA